MQTGRYHLFGHKRRFSRAETELVGRAGVSRAENDLRNCEWNCAQLFGTGAPPIVCNLRALLLFAFHARAASHGRITLCVYIWCVRARPLYLHFLHVKWNFWQANCVHARHAVRYKCILFTVRQLRVCDSAARERFTPAFPHTPTGATEI